MTTDTRSHATIRFVAKGVTYNGSGRKEAKGMVTIAGDPGYEQTAVMIAESALCLALDTDKLPEMTRSAGGIMTPSSAMGLALINRLKKAGIGFTITQPVK